MGVLGWYILTTVVTIGVVTTAAVYSAIEQLQKKQKNSTLSTFEKTRDTLITTGVWLGIKVALVWPHVLYTYLREQVLEELTKEKQLKDDDLDIGIR